MEPGVDQRPNQLTPSADLTSFSSPCDVRGSFNPDSAFVEASIQTIVENKRRIKPKRVMTTRKGPATRKSANEVSDQSKLSPDELPEGWIKEVKPRRKTPSKKDMYYTEIKSGVTLRSLKDVERYIATSDVRRCFTKPQIRSADEIETLKKNHSIASGSGSKPVEPVVTDPEPKPNETKKRSRKKARLTLKRKRNAVKKEAASSDPKPKETLSEPGHAESRTAPRRVKPRRELMQSPPVRASPRLSALNNPIIASEENSIADMAEDVGLTTQPGSEPEPDPLKEYENAIDAGSELKPKSDLLKESETTTETGSKPEAKPDSLRESETAIDAGCELEDKPDPLRESETAIYAGSELEPKPDPLKESDAVIDVGSELEPKPDMLKESDVAIETGSEPKHDPLKESDAANDAGSELEPKPDLLKEFDVAIETGSVPEPESKSKSDPLKEYESAIEIETESNHESKPDPLKEYESATKNCFQPEPKPELLKAETATKNWFEPEPKPDPLKESDTATKNQFKPEPKPKPKPDLLKESEPQPQPQPLKKCETEKAQMETEEPTKEMETEEPTKEALQKDCKVGPSMPGGEPGLGSDVMDHSSLFGDFWQDPCLGYAFKTLTGDMDDIPLDLGFGPSNAPPNNNNNNNGS